jgi:hypothetical protein
LHYEARADELELLGPAGRSDRFDDVSGAAPVDWLEALCADQRCVLITGPNLGLERATPERINTALQAGASACATVVVAGN